MSEHLVEIDLPSCLQRESLDSSLNEVFLWHGTSATNVNAIAQDGFDERLGCLEGMLGAGIYFAEDSCKSGQYSEKSFVNQRSHWFFLSRVMLGRPYYTNDPIRYIRKPPNACESVVFSPDAASIIGHHREFVVYDRFQAYPEYIVEALTTT